MARDTILLIMMKILFLLILAGDACMYDFYSYEH